MPPPPLPTHLINLSYLAPSPHFDDAPLAHFFFFSVAVRDIKPENLLIMGNALKIADFGSCRGIYSKQPYTEYISTRWYRAPECLLTDGYYGYKMDMWGLGCVMFETLALYPLFPGSNEADQIEKIHKILGTPAPELIAKFKPYASTHVNFNFNQHKRHPLGLAKLLSNVSPEAIDLMHKLLIYDPDERIAAKDCLKHPWFSDLRAAERKQREEAKEKKARSEAEKAAGEGGSSAAAAGSGEGSAAAGGSASAAPAAAGAQAASSSSSSSSSAFAASPTLSPPLEPTQPRAVDPNASHHSARHLEKGGKAGAEEEGGSSSGAGGGASSQYQQQQQQAEAAKAGWGGGSKAKKDGSSSSTASSASPAPARAGDKGGSGVLSSVVSGAGDGTTGRSGAYASSTLAGGGGGGGGGGVGGSSKPHPHQSQGSLVAAAKFELSNLASQQSQNGTSASGKGAYGASGSHAAASSSSSYASPTAAQYSSGALGSPSFSSPSSHAMGAAPLGKGAAGSSGGGGSTLVAGSLGISPNFSSPSNALLHPQYRSALQQQQQLLQGSGLRGMVSPAIGGAGSPVVASGAGSSSKQPLGVSSLRGLVAGGSGSSPSLAQPASLTLQQQQAAQQQQQKYGSSINSNGSSYNPPSAQLASSALSPTYANIRYAAGGLGGGGGSGALKLGNSGSLGATGGYGSGNSGNLDKLLSIGGGGGGEEGHAAAAAAGGGGQPSPLLNALGSSPLKSTYPTSTSSLQQQVQGQGRTLLQPMGSSIRGAAAGSSPSGATLSNPGGGNRGGGLGVLQLNMLGGKSGGAGSGAAQGGTILPPLGSSLRGLGGGALQLGLGTSLRSLRGAYGGGAPSLGAIGVGGAGASMLSPIRYGGGGGGGGGGGVSNSGMLGGMNMLGGGGVGGGGGGVGGGSSWTRNNGGGGSRRRLAPITSSTRIDKGSLAAYRRR